MIIILHNSSSNKRLDNVIIQDLKNLLDQSSNENYEKVKTIITPRFKKDLMKNLKYLNPLTIKKIFNIIPKEWDDVYEFILNVR